MYIQTYGFLENKTTLDLFYQYKKKNNDVNL